MSDSSNNLAQHDVEWKQGDVTQILTFKLNNEEYGVDILQVNTIREWTPITNIPDMPSYVRGVLNIRGDIVPIIDLRERLALTTVEYTATTVVILLNINFQERDMILGIVVDSVSDTYTIKPQDIKAKPQVGEHIQVNYLKGLIEMNERLILLLDCEKLLSEKHLEQIPEQPITA